ncbi:vWA domain-containing protein [Vibrio sp. VB16]|uniref:vWA domain-containing protein n=1 Tax=Vibrio sp. VB16 TaxID=2785746 RepID=UPI003FCCA2BE
MHFEFMWWGMLFLLPLPILIYFFAPSVKENAAITLPYLPNEGSISAPSNLFAKIIAALIWLLFVLSCARPVWYGEPIESQPKHRDMMLVVDLSGSMDTKDMAFEDQYIDRLTAVKNVLTDFIKKRKGDRLGLVLFADHAYLQTPLTLDRHTITSQLNQAVLGLVGNKTAIGEGIGLATKTFVDSDAPQRVIILLSDGENTAGVLDPLKAAEIAKKYKTTIYTVGVGAGEMVVQEFFMSRKVNTAKDLDESSLTKIAEMTGGEYFRARNQDDLENIYNTINELEPISGATQIWRPQTEWFNYPLGMALILSVVLVVGRKIRV